MFENVDGRRTDAGVTGILLAHLGAFGSGELKIQPVWRSIALVTNFYSEVSVTSVWFSADHSPISCEIFDLKHSAY